MITLGAKSLLKAFANLKNVLAIYIGNIKVWPSKYAWPTPTISIENSTLSTDEVEGVTKYKVWIGGIYYGYYDQNDVWHQVYEPPVLENGTLTISTVYAASQSGDTLTIE